MEVTLRYRLTWADFVEVEDGLASHVGLDAPARGAFRMLGWRLAITLAGLGQGEATIDDAGIRIERGPVRPWSEFSDTFETERLLAFVVGSTAGPIMLPKRAMKPADLAGIRQIAAGVTHDHDPIIATLSRRGR